MKETTQKAIILAELKDGKKVTALEAFNFVAVFACLR